MCQICGRPECPGGKSIPLSVYVPGTDPDDQENGITFCVHDPKNPERVLLEVPLAAVLLQEAYPVDSKIRAVYFLEQLIEKLNDQIDNPKGLTP